MGRAGAKKYLFLAHMWVPLGAGEDGDGWRGGWGGALQHGSLIGHKFLGVGKYVPTTATKGGYGGTVISDTPEEGEGIKCNEDDTGRQGDAGSGDSTPPT